MQGSVPTREIGCILGNSAKAGDLGKFMNTARRWPVTLLGPGLGLGLGLGGCAGDLTATTPPQPAPANYRQMTPVYFAAALPKQPLAGATISVIRPAVAPQPWDWIACVKLAGGEYYAVFYAEGKAVDARIALTVDRCAAADGYAPFPSPTKRKPAAKTKKGLKN